MWLWWTRTEMKEDPTRSDSGNLHGVSCICPKPEHMLMNSRDSLPKGFMKTEVNRRSKLQTITTISLKITPFIALQYKSGQIGARDVEEQQLDDALLKVLDRQLPELMRNTCVAWPRVCHESESKKASKESIKPKRNRWEIETRFNFLHPVNDS
ncbi:hypothetical protein Tco_0702316 [Tanacetum coccineum]|uniref:Uncharacterized protein n=1 Tax=Tanacetum coccineum TaxID=301880 RepID=A0ABQ4XXC7_9ASTR